MNITLCGNDARLSVCQKTLSALPFGGTLYLLPIPSFRPGIAPPFEGIAPRAGDVVVGYGIPQEEEEKLTGKGARLFDLEKNEAYQKAGAELTAIGIFSHILKSGKTAPADLSVGIVGYGKIGQALLKILCFFGAKLSVYTRDTARVPSLLPLGIGVYPSAPFCYHGEDVLVNTAPAHLLCREAFADRLPLILDVATGKCLEGDLPFVKLPGIPVSMFETSAARLFTDTVRRLLEDLT